MDTRRTEFVTVRLSSREKAIVRKLAAIDQRPVSEWLRELIRRRAERQGMWPVASVPGSTS